MHDFTVLAAPYTSPETKQAKNKGGGQMRERDKETKRCLRMITISRRRKMSGEKNTLWRVYDDWNDRLPNMPESPIEIVPAGAFSFLQIIALMRARISRYFTICARTNDMIIIHF